MARPGYAIVNGQEVPKKIVLIPDSPAGTEVRANLEKAMFGEAELRNKPGRRRRRV